MNANGRARPGHFAGAGYQTTGAGVAGAADVRKVPVWRTFVLTFRDVSTVLYAMPLKVLIAAVIQALTMIALSYFGGSDPAVRNWPLEIVVTVICTFGTLPYAIAIYRLILLGEIVPGYVFDIRDPRLMALFQYSILLMIPVWIVWWLGLSILGLTVGEGFAVTMLVSLIVGTASVLLFPAIAIDRPMMLLKAAFALKGNYLRVAFLAIAIFVSVPAAVFLVLVIISIVLVPVMGQKELQDAFTLLNVPLTILIVFVLQTLFVILGAHLLLMLDRPEIPWSQRRA